MSSHNTNSKRVLSIFVDAGFQESASPTHSSARQGSAGLGVWIPSIGTGVALSAKATDNNEAESLAILIGVVIGRMMSLTNAVVLTDSRVNCDRLATRGEKSEVLCIVESALKQDGVLLEWRPRENTSLADFFASLALNGKNLIATAANAKNPAEKFRPLLHLERENKEPLKDATVNWLSLPTQNKAANFQTTEVAGFFPNLELLLNHKIPLAEFLLLAEHFSVRAQKSRKR